jgi:hypothetical protein
LEVVVLLWLGDYDLHIQRTFILESVMLIAHGKDRNKAQKQIVERYRIVSPASMERDGIVRGKQNMQNMGRHRRSGNDFEGNSSSTDDQHQ